MRNQQAFSFRIVGKGTAIDAGRQLSVEMGRFNMEANGTQEVDVYYDPDLRPGRLLMRNAESPYIAQSSSPAFASDPDKMVPFHSRHREKLSSFGFLGHREEGVMRWRLDISARTLANPLFYTSAGYADMNPASKRALVTECIATSLRLSKWSEVGMTGTTSMIFELPAQIIEALPPSLEVCVSPWASTQQD